MVVVVLLLLGGLAVASVALARGLGANQAADLPPPATSASPKVHYSQEVADALARAQPLELATLKHLRRQGMQTFLADRDSPLLRRLASVGLVSPMGSTAYPADAYPYRVPNEVWAQLAVYSQTGSVDAAPNSASDLTR